MYDREGTTGMGLNLGIVYTIETYLSIHQRKCFVCIAHFEPKASEAEEQKISPIDQCLPRRLKSPMLRVFPVALSIRFTAFVR